MFHTLSTIGDYKQGALRKRPLTAYFLDHFKKIKIRYMSIFSFIILNWWIIRSIGGALYSLSTLQRYVQSALRKKELIAFFGEYFNENTICIDFQFHDPKIKLFHNLFMR